MEVQILNLTAPKLEEQHLRIQFRALMFPMRERILTLITMGPIHFIFTLLVILGGVPQQPTVF